MIVVIPIIQLKKMMKRWNNYVSLGFEDNSLIKYSETFFIRTPWDRGVSITKNCLLFRILQVF